MSHHLQDTGGADVPVLPPVLYAVPFAALSVLGRAVPLRLPGGWLTRVGGMALLATGLGLVGTGAGAVLGHDTTLEPRGEVSTIVRDGPYRFTRNPIYLGLALAYAGGSLAQRAPLPLLALPGVLAGVQKLVVEREERYLRGRFGPAYDAYCATVRRWL
ncbi:MAG TPA: isoprenylcysteine carboxylmethyltransferase family protein [Segeticoccus sp.]|nr:isoprenylcysteine carboxylmethyltransferase family protein [Segeticoccus sp.]